MAALADMVTRRLGLSDAERRSVHYASLLHDIGKVMLDPAVLRADGPLTAESAKIIAGAFRPRRRAPEADHDLGGHPPHRRAPTTSAGTAPAIRAAARRGHPVGARVVAVADAFDAMTRVTPHGKHRSAERRWPSSRPARARQFDPRIVRLFVAEYRQRRHQIPTS